MISKHLAGFDHQSFLIVSELEISKRQSRFSII